jgi:deoxycytidine triphosphate deaminase
MLKSDRWIRKMSKEHDMINPFFECFSWKSGPSGPRLDIRKITRL